MASDGGLEDDEQSIALLALSPPMSRGSKSFLRRSSSWVGKKQPGVCATTRRIEVPARPDCNRPPAESKELVKSSSMRESESGKVSSPCALLPGNVRAAQLPRTGLAVLLACPFICQHQGATGTT